MVVVVVVIVVVRVVVVVVGRRSVSLTYDLPYSSDLLLVKAELGVVMVASSIPAVAAAGVGSSL